MYNGASVPPKATIKAPRIIPTLLPMLIRTLGAVRGMSLLAYISSPGAAKDSAHNLFWHVDWIHMECNSLNIPYTLYIVPVSIQQFNSIRQVINIP